MLHIFSSLKSLVQPKRCLIDNITFRLHYQLTFALLCFFSLMQTLTQFFGNPIQCYSDEFVLKEMEKVMNTYCWVHGTFTLPYLVNCTPGVKCSAPGVGPEIAAEKGRVEQSGSHRKRLFHSVHDKPSLL